MLEIGIPVYKAKDTLPDLLDSLVAQTKKMFIVCLSIDGDNEDYSDIINTYKARGLKIRTLIYDENGGAGAARQRVLNTTQCDYIMFADADDLLMPRAVEILHRGITTGGFDIVRSDFIRENNKEDQIFKATENTITWFHGKIYRVEYLKRIKLSFLPGLRTDEDAYFNMLAWNATDNKGVINEVTYLWRNNPSSVTRRKDNKTYFIDHHMDYIHGQIEALKRIFIIRPDISPKLATVTLINIYYYYMTARYYHCDEEEMDKCISSLRDREWMQTWIATGQNWLDVVENLKSALILDGSTVCFFSETFDVWVMRLLKGDK